MVKIIYHPPHLSSPSRSPSFICKTIAKRLSTFPFPTNDSASVSPRHENKNSRNVRFDDSIVMEIYGSLLSYPFMYIEQKDDCHGTKETPRRKTIISYEKRHNKFALCHRKFALFSLESTATMLRRPQFVQFN
jgi:hypothetical protein